MNPKLLFTLIKREVLEHKNIIRVPLILLGLALLVRVSMMFGNLSLNVDVPEQLQLDQTITNIMNAAIGKALNMMNFISMTAMLIVAASYALFSLYNERQDDSVLFWRSLPVSDTLTVASKFIVALVLVPLIILVLQAITSVLFLGGDSFAYLSSYFPKSIPTMLKLVMWSLLPIVAWCVFCSSVAKKSPFLLALIAPILFIMMDKLFLNGSISQHFIIDRVKGFDNFTMFALATGVVFSAVCFVIAAVKRSQRF